MTHLCHTCKKPLSLARVQSLEERGISLSYIDCVDCILKRVKENSLLNIKNEANENIGASKR